MFQYYNILQNSTPKDEPNILIVVLEIILVPDYRYKLSWVNDNPRYHWLSVPFFDFDFDATYHS